MFLHVSIGKEDKHEESRKTLEVIAEKREEMQSTIAKGKQKVHTCVWKAFEESYKLDLEVILQQLLTIYAAGCKPPQP